MNERGIWAMWALLPGGVTADVRVICADDGTIDSVEAGVNAHAGDVQVGLLLPGMANLHSHAFQYAMTGLAEAMGDTEDSFWGWRETMYRFALRLTPEQIGAIAHYLYIQMVKAGYTSVGEFHYLHHQPDGTAYAPPEQMALAIASAAQDAGIGLRLLPVLYQTADVGGEPAGERQRRFVHSTEAYLTLLSRLAAHNVPLGACFHSLRAVPKEAMQGVLAALPSIGLSDVPVHLHIAEQQKEVDAVEAFYGARPVAWLLDSLPVDERWCLVHATHLNDEEIARLAGCRAVAGLCPTTEANLGDGVFPAKAYKEAGGQWGIGSDSHISVNPIEELRLLEYGQRLMLQRRTVLTDAEQPSCGVWLWHHAALGGAQALGWQGGAIAVGAFADVVAYHLDKPIYHGRSRGLLLDSMLFADSQACPRHVWVRGRHVVGEGRHNGEEKAGDAFRQVMAALA